MGAGAAGLMSAIFAARQNPSHKILLLDSRHKIGAKILISGGTRCNVTNRVVRTSDYEGGAKHFIRHVLEAFSPEKTIAFFEEIGVQLVLEPTGKYFPITHSGKTVLEALIKEAEKQKVILKTGVAIRSIEKKDDLFYLGSGAAAKCVILATGGLSLPETGSDGAGLRIAESLGHTIIRTAPALTPLMTEDKVWQDLSGIALNVKLSYFGSGKKKAQSEGAMLFTHFGFSGPAALDISRHVALSEKGKFKVEADFLPQVSENEIYSELEDEKFSGKSLKNFLNDKWGLPDRFSQALLSKIVKGQEFTMKRLPAPLKKKLINALFHYPLEVTGVFGYKKAEATCGGVDLKEIRVQSMESKRVPGLYFAGEILDVDGRIGGFNFQWAWSSGALAGSSAAESLI